MIRKIIVFGGQKEIAYLVGGKNKNPICKIEENEVGDILIYSKNKSGNSYQWKKIKNSIPFIIEYDEGKVNI